MQFVLAIRIPSPETAFATSLPSALRFHLVRFLLRASVLRPATRSRSYVRYDVLQCFRRLDASYSRDDVLERIRCLGGV